MTHTESNSAMAAIGILQKLQFREIPVLKFEQSLKSNKFLPRLLDILSNVKDISSKSIQFSSLCNTSSYMPNIQVIDKVVNADERMNKVLTVYEDTQNSSEKICSILDGSTMHYREAKFYLDLLNGYRFGIPKSMLKIEKNVVMKPSLKVGKTKLNLPYFGERLYEGFRFLFKKRGDKYKIVDDKGKVYTDKFDFYDWMKCLKVENVDIDFMVIPSNESSWAYYICKQNIDLGQTDELLKVILDMNFKDDTPLQVRKNRVHKFVEKLSNMKVREASYRILESKKQVVSFTKKMLAKYGSCILKNGDSLYAVGQSNEWIKVKREYCLGTISDYKYKIINDRLLLDYIEFKTEDDKTLYIKDYKILNIEKVIQNFVGYTGKIQWNIETGIPVPVLYRIYNDF